MVEISCRRSAGERRAQGIQGHLQSRCKAHEKVRVAYDEACVGERARLVRLEKDMRRRGRSVPTLGPVRQWQREWVDTGVCAEAPIRQLLLPLQPPAEIVEAAANGSPSPSLTVPPGAQYHSNVIVYLEPAHVPARNGVVRPVYGYTAVRMEGPVWPILVDAFGAPPGARATQIRQAPPPDIGLLTAGVLGFVDAARRIIREGWAPPDGNTAVMVYAPREIMKYIAGVWNPHHPALTAAAVEARIALQKLQVSRPVFFREAPTDIQHQTFRDRALSLALYFIH